MQVNTVSKEGRHKLPCLLAFAGTLIQGLVPAVDGRRESESLVVSTVDCRYLDEGTVALAGKGERGKAAWLSQTQRQSTAGTCRLKLPPPVVVD
jgi:hypothetical protein